MITACTVGVAQCTLKVVMWRVSRWMAEHGLLAPEKTEVVILIKERVSTVFPIEVDENHGLVEADGGIPQHHDSHEEFLRADSLQGKKGSAHSVLLYGSGVWALWTSGSGNSRELLRSLTVLLSGILYTSERGDRSKEAVVCGKRVRTFCAWQQSWERESKSSKTSGRGSIESEQTHPFSMQ